MLTQKAIDTLLDYNTELDNDVRCEISELITEFELFRQHVLMRTLEIEAAANNLPRD